MHSIKLLLTVWLDRMLLWIDYILAITVSVIIAMAL